MASCSPFLYCGHETPTVLYPNHVYIFLSMRTVIMVQTFFSRLPQWYIFIYI